MSGGTYDVAIIGAGIMGTALALELVTSGVSVALLDRVGICAGSSARSAGGVRHQFGVAVNIELARRTIARLEHFTEEFGLDCGLRQVGYMFLISEERSKQVFTAAVELQRSLGVDSQILSPEEVAQLVPGIRTDDLLGASFCPRDGFLDPNTVTTAFAATAKARGATLLPTTGVTGLEVTGSRVTSIQTADGSRLGADIVVNAAGAWAPAIARLYGGKLPISPWRSQIFTVHDAPDFGERLPMVIDFDRGKAYFHSEGAGLLVGMDNEGAADPSWDPQVDWTKFDDVAVRLTERVPALATARVVSAWAGFLEITPDEDPIVGWTDLDNVYTTAGFSGHGVSIAPALATEVALELRGLQPTVDLSRYRFGRFAEAAREPEPFAMR